MSLLKLNQVCSLVCEKSQGLESMVTMQWSTSNRQLGFNKIYDQTRNKKMMGSFNIKANFVNNLKVIYKNFNIVMTRHFPALETKSSNLNPRLDKLGKIKDINTIKRKGEET